MGKYTNLNREEINKRVEELIAQYEEHGIELKLNADDIYDKRQYEIWYGGEIAAFKYRNRYSVSIEVKGDVRADLNDENGGIAVRVKDKQDSGRFYDEMHPYIADDETLDRYLGYDGKNRTGEARLVIWDNNWMEVQIYDNKESRWLDIGFVLENVGSVLDIGYEDVMQYVDCYVYQYEDQQEKSKRRGKTKRRKNPQDA